ncbi:DUF3592 domain-containing protein [Tenacibaculum soleae]|uniref:DUF3592 domain-containing protein n=1 Tax=Tenacibaculum soleae TaxID=447689 RepID=UPI002300C836|nr:DUF3592 domain-containing protein [Tenacibaculum soleae]
MKYIILLSFLLLSTYCYSQEEEWIKTEGEITEITFHRGKKTRENAIIKFTLENGEEQLGSAELFRIPFVGSMKSIGDKISINYKKSNPALLETTLGNFLTKYGMYILIFLGIIFSIKPFLNRRKKEHSDI